MDGALAQLVERLHGMQEVRGSTPLGSTSPFNDLATINRIHSHAVQPYVTHMSRVAKSFASAPLPFVTTPYR